MGRETEARMKKAIEATLHEFNTVRTGRASPALLEGVVVEYYGAKTPLNQLATITAPEARMLVVQPWDKGAMKDIQKAITASNLGLNPSTDGANLRITIPELTEERRKDLAKVVRQTAEDGRVSIRQVRRDAIDELRKQEKASDISEDDSRREQAAVQKLTDQYIEQVDELLTAKEEELLTI
ncbi:ribosome recycling factor [Candidatus Poribacteria bacterium]|jgi:ribosome recycling factor|nr:ribosome recycling factor [Candidatus Poribacteria bacterium]MBT5535192.1 ribosome recycling factor [Candidatus Poribacteria bacterium]MBT5715062.1 ribosome recycling factor [Candidatus Poribacteria bacterium]MBT7096906.1 ribosome recycling factor [Candidatus Poribacteria bacterium]MBT7806802.1 ribosome recycling factor [Candidatus Poribacteria bacterium]